MKINTVFFLLLTGLVLSFSQSAHAMFVSNGTRKVAARGCTKRVDNKQCAILDYQSGLHKQPVAEIAFKYMHKLTSEVRQVNPWTGRPESEDDRLKFLWNDFMPTLNDESTTKVYLIDGKVAGFVNYHIDHNGWNVLFPCLGPTANINYLAVDEHYQDQGVGTALLKHVLQDCQNQSVHCVMLATTGLDEKLRKYYGKFGFYCYRESKYTGVGLFRKRLKSHPVILLSTAAFEWLKKCNGE